MFNDPLSLPVFKALHAKDAKFFRTEQTMAEFCDVIKRTKFKLDEVKASECVLLWTALSQCISPEVLTKIKCRDPLDQKFLDAALFCAPSLLITKDKDLLKLKRKALRQNVQILRPADLFKLLESEASRQSE